MVDTLVTLRPTGVSAQVSSSGGTTHPWTYGNMGDNLDTTFSTQSGPDNETNQILLTLNTISIPALAQIKYLRARVRAKVSAVTGQHSLDFGLWNTDFGLPLPGQIYAGWSEVALTTAVANYSGPPILDWGGSPWTQDIINKLLFTFYSQFGLVAGKTFTVYEGYVDVYYNQAPTITVNISPATPITTTAKPQFSVNYLDPEGDPLQYMTIRIFTDAQYGAGGFDPDTSPAYWEKIDYNTTQIYYQITDPMENDTYRAYIKVADAGSNRRYSAWATRDFVINTPISPLPTMALIGDVANARVRVSCTQGSSPSTDWFVINRSDDGGVTWIVPRGGDHFLNAIPGSANYFYDYEAAPNTDVQYRIKAVRKPGTEEFPSTFTSPATIQLPTTNFWIKDPLDPTKNRIIHLNGTDFSTTRQKGGGTFIAFGRKNAIAVRDIVHGVDFELSIRTDNEAEFDAIVAMFSNPAHPVLLVQSDMKKQWFVDAGQLSEQLFFFSDRVSTPTRILTLPVSEVDAP